MSVGPVTFTCASCGEKHAEWPALENHEVTYFGWLSNWLPDYEYSGFIPMTVYAKRGNQRPEIIPHADPDHPFVRDYFAGISLEEAERRIAAMSKV